MKSLLLQERKNRRLLVNANTNNFLDFCSGFFYEPAYVFWRDVMFIDLLLKELPADIDAALIITPQNRRYFTSFDSSDGFLLVTRSGSVFYTDSRYIEAAEKTVKNCDVIEGREVWKQIKDYLTAANAKNIAIEASGITVSQFNNLKNNKNLSSFELICDGRLDSIINALRSVKTPEDVNKIRRAQEIAEKGFLHMLDFIKKGMTEREIRLELDFFMLKNGAEALSFDTIAVSGVNSSMPHGVPTDKKIEDGDFLTLDFGAVFDGYHSDMTRTVAIGRVSDEQRYVYDVVLKAQEAALGVLKDGLSCSQADKAARDIIAESGFGDFFGHGTGHGVGIEIHELPNLSPKSASVLVSGNIVTVEPGIYLPGKFGVRIEDMALITKNGCENLTSAEKSLIII